MIPTNVFFMVLFLTVVLIVNQNQLWIIGKMKVKGDNKRDVYLATAK